MNQKQDLHYQLKIHGSSLPLTLISIIEKALKKILLTMVNEPLQHDAYGEEFKGLRIPETFNTRRLGLLQPLSDKFHS